MDINVNTCFFALCHISSPVCIYEFIVELLPNKYLTVCSHYLSSIYICHLHWLCNCMAKHLASSPQ